MILRIHFHTQYGHSDWMPEKEYDWPLTCTVYDELTEELNKKYFGAIITGITPLLNTIQLGLE